METQTWALNLKNTTKCLVEISKTHTKYSTSTIVTQNSMISLPRTDNMLFTFPVMEKFSVQMSLKAS